MLSDKELAESLTDAEVQRRIVEAKNARALLWSQITERDVFLCGAKWMLEQIVAGKVRSAVGVTPSQAPRLGCETFGCSTDKCSRHPGCGCHDPEPATGVAPTDGGKNG